MNIFKKNNGVNWQQEVFDTSKLIRTILEKQESIDDKFNDHVEAGREQRIEDKKWQTELLKKSSKCAKAEQIEEIQADVNIFKNDKIERKGKILGMKSLHAYAIGAMGFAIMVLGILWGLRRFGLL